MKNQLNTPSFLQDHQRPQELVFTKSQGVQAEGLINDNALMMIVLVFSSLNVVSMEGIVPERGLPTGGWGRAILKGGGEVSGDEEPMTVFMADC